MNKNQSLSILHVELLNLKRQKGEFLPRPRHAPSVSPPSHLLPHREVYSLVWPRVPPGTLPSSPTANCPGTAPGAGLGAIPGLLGQFKGFLGQFKGLLGQCKGLLGQFKGLLGKFKGLLGQLPGWLGQFKGLPGQLLGLIGQFPG